MYFDPLSAVRFIKTSRLFEFLQQTAVSENNVRHQGGACKPPGPIFWQQNKWDRTLFTCWVQKRSTEPNCHGVNNYSGRKKISLLHQNKSAVPKSVCCAETSPPHQNLSVTEEWVCHAQISLPRKNQSIAEKSPVIENSKSIKVWVTSIQSLMFV